MPASSSEVFNVDPMMETAMTMIALDPMLVLADLTMERAQAHFNAAMAEEELTPVSMLLFWQAQEEQRYNLILLKQHLAVSANHVKMYLHVWF